LHESTTKFYENPSGTIKREIMGLRGYPHMRILLFAVKNDITHKQYNKNFKQTVT